VIEEDDEDTGPVRLWPAAVVLALAAVAALVATVVVLSGGDQRGDGGRQGARPVRILLAVAEGSDMVRIVTVTGGCREATAATADLRADAIGLEVLARNAGDEGDDGDGRSCADVARCHQVTLPQAVGPRRLLPHAVADAELRARAEALAANGPCALLPLED